MSAAGAPSEFASAIEERTVRHVVRHIVPFLAVLFIVNFLDRTNVGFAALQMNGDIGISQTIYGLGAGVFFLGYFAFEVPSNVMLHKFGPRIWIARIMVTWGLVASAMGFLRTPVHFVVLRILLGTAEAGFFPGVIYLLSLWIPRRYHARTIARFYLGIPISQVIGAPLSVALMQAGGRFGVSGWRLMYICEGIPAMLLGIACLFYLTNSPAQATWLAPDERAWLVETMDAENREKLALEGAPMSRGAQLRSVLTNKLVWALAFIYFGITSGSNSLNFFFPTVLQSFRATFGLNISLLANGFITAIPYAAAAAAMLFWTRHSDRAQERCKHTGAAALMAAASIAISLVVNHPVVIVIGFVLMGAGVYSAINVFWAIPQQALTGLEAAAGIALINSIGNLSGFAGPYITGSLRTLTGNYTLAFFVVAAFVALGGAGMFLIPAEFGVDTAKTKILESAR